MLTQLINAKILTPQGWVKDGSVIIRDNKILEVTNCDLAVIGANLIDVKGMYVVPGAVEMHCHGGEGNFATLIRWGPSPQSVGSPINSLRQIPIRIYGPLACL